jgi:hypothetical protein
MLFLDWHISAHKMVVESVDLIATTYDVVAGFTSPFNVVEPRAALLVKWKPLRIPWHESFPP